jgi:acyl-CoA synthetase (AMP-forming)/AMP-acid ligase II
MYGLTETKRALYLPPELLDTKPGSVGIAIPGTEVWLEDPEGHRLGPDTTGELVVRGRHVMRGYWEAPDATAERFKPGPLPAERVCHTGDLFRMDAEGCMTFVGRNDDIIKSRGEKVSPKEIENVLYSLRAYWRPPRLESLTPSWDKRSRYLWSSPIRRWESPRSLPIATHTLRIS